MADANASALAPMRKLLLCIFSPQDKSKINQKSYCRYGMPMDGMHHAAH
jgi:hypothetical protein